MRFRLMLSILWLNIYVVAVFRHIVVEWVYVNAVKVYTVFWFVHMKVGVIQSDFFALTGDSFECHQGYMQPILVEAEYITTGDKKMQK